MLCSKCKNNSGEGCKKNAVTQEEYDLGVEQCFHFKREIDWMDIPNNHNHENRVYNNSRGV